MERDTVEEGPKIAGGVEQLDGGQALIEWFGAIPTFHDAALLGLELRQTRPSHLRFRTSRFGPAVDPEGYLLQTKASMVTFEIRGLVEAKLFEFVETGVLDGLTVTVDDGDVTHLSGTYAASARIASPSVSMMRSTWWFSTMSGGERAMVSPV